MTHTNIEQQRAAYALKYVKAKTQNLNDDDRREWRSRANELPAMIQMNGIGATVAFYASKESSTHQKLLTILTGWLCDGEKGIYPGEISLIDALINSDMHTYRTAQAEAQAFLAWVKKFSKVYCREEKSEKKDTEGAADD